VNFVPTCILLLSLSSCFDAIDFNVYESAQVRYWQVTNCLVAIILEKHGLFEIRRNTQPLG
jgi:hypothetical protein